MNREEYQRKYSGGYHRTGSPLEIPHDVVRLTEHEPCFLCGIRAGLPCRHRPWSEAA